ncbi:MAG: hypothetical protein KAJ20_02020 [Candidatus Aenigmarchaeota archaeon]|nr:hypothetical protein [Candidatus Aenigmarchaeota archaeon]
MTKKDTHMATMPSIDFVSFFAEHLVLLEKAEYYRHKKYEWEEEIIKPQHV